MIINLLIIATNQYVQFLEELLDSAHKYFLPAHDVRFVVFTDRINEAEWMAVRKDYDAYYLEVEHKPFPAPTLYRYHFFKQHRSFFKKNNADFYFYIDVDTLIKRNISDEILSDRTVVQHCGYVNGGGTFERNPKSTSYVEGEHPYYGGGFWGFSEEEFWRFVYRAVDMIDEDERNGIVPVWHDESVLNRYMIDNPPTKVLTPSFHYPENNQRIISSWKEHYDCTILLLDKDHKAIRT